MSEADQILLLLLTLAGAALGGGGFAGWLWMRGKKPPIKTINEMRRDKGLPPIEAKDVTYSSPKDLEICSHCGRAFPRELLGIHIIQDHGNLARKGVPMEGPDLVLTPEMIKEERERVQQSVEKWEKEHFDAVAARRQKRKPISEAAKEEED